MISMTRSPKEKTTPKGGLNNYLVRRRHPPEAYAARRSPSKAIGAAWRAAFAFAKEITLEPLASNVSSFAIKLTSHYVTNQIVLRVFRRPVECRDSPKFKFGGADGSRTHVQNV